MSSCGIDRLTGQPLYGFDHVRQSVDVILDTDLGARVMLRHFGGALRRFLGRKITPDVLALATAVFALSVVNWEPRLRVLKVSIAPSVEAIRAGTVLFLMDVAYRPRGHLGDPTEEMAYFGVGLTEDGVLQTMRVAA